MVIENGASSVTARANIRAYLVYSPPSKRRGVQSPDGMTNDTLQLFKFLVTATRWSHLWVRNEAVPSLSYTGMMTSRYKITYLFSAVWIPRSNEVCIVYSVPPWYSTNVGWPNY